MRQIDSYAHSNKLSRLHPAYKAGCSLLALTLCLALDHPTVSLLITALMLALTVGWAGLPWRFVLRLLGAEGGFLLTGVLGIAISVRLSFDQAGGLGPVQIGVTAESVQQALHVFLRALGGAAALNFLALTTPAADLLELLRSLRAPATLIEIMGLTYRFIFALFDSLERMTMAQEVRLGFADWRNSLRSAALIGTNLFVEAFRRSRALETALQARAWTG
ncbi:MAG: cobalt ECF transporter T component CbiQ, partial [Anaerolineae bacterium]|nr:cobalt ECF transporter T component CbiQ [Anaerolineae bacterium]